MGKAQRPYPGLGRYRSVTRHLLIFGEGYTGTRLRAKLERDGWHVSGTDRTGSDGKLAFDGTHALPPSLLEGVTHVLCSIPPDDCGDVALQCHDQALAKLDSLEWAGYLSTTGIYGDHQGAWVTEDTPPVPTSERANRRLVAESQWLSWGASKGKTVQIFRLAGIYGPGRSALERVQAADARSVIKPGHAMNRIHVDDIVKIICAAITRPDAGPIFNCADDEPSPTAEVQEFAAALIGIPPPPRVPISAANLSGMARSFYADNRRVSNQRVKDQLGVTFTFPTYREGLRAIASAKNAG